MLTGYLFTSLLIAGTIGGFYILIKTRQIESETQSSFLNSGEPWIRHSAD